MHDGISQLKTLRVETARYDNIPRDENLRSHCNCNKIGDETHLLLIKLPKLLVDKKHDLQFLKQILKSHLYDYYQMRPCDQI